MIKSALGILSHFPDHANRCTLCNSSDLTFEHIPPQSSFNNTPVKDWVDDGVFRGHKSLTKMRKGMGRFSLCSICNNTIGSRYSKHFQDWSTQAYELVEQSTGYEYAKRIFRIKPFFVAKQLALMAVAMGHEDYADRDWFRNLQEIAKNEDENILPTELTFWSYLVEDNHVRLSGITTYATTQWLSSPLAYCEIARKPLGYLVMWNTEVARIFAKAVGMVCLDNFFSYSDKEYHTFTLKMRKLSTKSFAAFEYEGVTSNVSDWA